MLVSDYDLVVVGGGFAGAAAALSLPAGTLVLRANTFGRLIGASVANSLTNKATATD
jgi:glycine/D-amino acid oxidase-like deaminating enzyme